MDIIRKSGLWRGVGRRMGWDNMPGCSHSEPAPHLRQSAICAELGWLPQLPLLEGRRYLQPSLPPHLPGYDSAPEPLLHQLLSQHLPSGGPALWPEQRRGIYTVQWEGLQLVRRDHMCSQWLTGIEKMSWGSLGPRMPGYLRSSEEILKTDRRVVLKLSGYMELSSHSQAMKCSWNPEVLTG